MNKMRQKEDTKGRRKINVCSKVGFGDELAL